MYLKISEIICYNKMNSESLDIVALIEKNPITRLKETYNNRFVEKIKNNFNNTEQQLFLGSFYCYLNYNTTNDFVIQLNDVWKWLGFSRIDPCKRVLEKNFTKDVDYKIVLSELNKKDDPEVEGADKLNNELIFHQVVEKKNKETRGRKEETILLTIKTFKKLCLKSNTKKADEIHDYFIKLEEILQDVLKEEAEELQNQLQTKENQLKEQSKRIQVLEHKPITHGFSARRKGYVYIIKDRAKPGHYKIGMTYNVDKRLRNLNTSSSEKSLVIYFEKESFDCELLERTVQSILQPFNIAGRREWFFFSDKIELQYAHDVINKTDEFLNTFNLASLDEMRNYLENEIKQNGSAKQECDQEVEQEVEQECEQECEQEYKQEYEQEYEQECEEQVEQEVEQECEQQAEESVQQDIIKETNIYKLTGQRLKNKTGDYKGVFWINEKKKWRAALKMHYKEIFLGYYNTDLEAAKVYNDYAIYINNNNNTNYTLNDIDDYISNPRDVVAENNERIESDKTSKYYGVSYRSNRQHYIASIKYNGKSYNLGGHKVEIECAKLYNQQALYFNNTLNTNYLLNDIPNYITIAKDIFGEIQKNKNDRKSSKYYGVTFTKQRNKFRAVLVYNKKQYHLGFFDDEIDAAKAYNTKASELNNIGNVKYKLNEF